MIFLRNVSKLGTEGRKGKKRRPPLILNQLNVHIRTGEFVYVVGPSGAGKSTLLQLLYKEINPDSGELRVNGRNLRKMKRREIPYLRREIGVVFQDFRLLPQTNIADNITYALDIVNTPPELIPRRVDQVLKVVGLSHKKSAVQLSGGEAQRVAIARAVVNQPRILLADEPTGDLDPQNARNVIHLLERLNQRGVTVLMTTHNLGLVRQFPHRVIHLDQGQIVQDVRMAPSRQ
ncbi:cell division ATP-binding protein FtsE [Enterococcus florum]|uniref:Cell division ATP-binding protein FtsE n=1 Tax=Enterococcus florum TaxID=2480627 RepID=A0A4P5PFY7_9ENTE|nr:ATP-binding cassette domain-containing protein [Enterococcus florum]GCF95694.1 cell division ATP-binding protein FtsE [Enterococcus florum]